MRANMADDASIGGTEIRFGIPEHRVEVLAGPGTLLETGQREGERLASCGGGGGPAVRSGCSVPGGDAHASGRGLISVAWAR